MTRNELDDITGQLAHIEGLICELREALETLASDASEAADAIENDTPEEPDEPEEPVWEWALAAYEEPVWEWALAAYADDEAAIEAHKAAMETHEAAVAANKKIRERIDRMETLAGLLRDLENADHPQELEVDECGLEDAYSALNE